jgi:hypothetical protein
MNDEEQRDDNTDCHPNFNAPTDRQSESKEHETEVDPSAHPAAQHMIKCNQHQLRKLTDLQ